MHVDERLATRVVRLCVCVENTCRSQTAAGFARLHCADRVEVHSAGSKPATAVDPRAVGFMAELGCDISAEISNPLRAFADQAFDAVVTMSCGDACPWAPARVRENWALPDPTHLSDDEFCATRDEIELRARRLLHKFSVQQDQCMEPSVASASCRYSL